MIFAVELERRVTGSSILGIIIDKFRYKKKLCLVILFEINKSLKIDFHYIILYFDLTIHLWVKDGREFPLDVEKIA